MGLFSWDAYTAGEVNEKIQYWVDMWEDSIDNFNKRLYGFDLINPHVLIKEIIDEINSNHLQNDENRKYFRRKLSVASCDPTLTPQSYSEFFLLKSEFDKGSNPYLLQLCQIVLNAFRSGKYFTEAFDLLRTKLLNSVWEDKDQESIITLSHHLIVELLLKGYSLKKIKYFPRNLFTGYEEEFGVVRTEYPKNTNWQDFIKNDNDVDQQAYNQAVKAEMDSLNIEQRLQRFSSYFSTVPEEGYFIFQIEGLKGHADFNIGNVNFYSPQDKRYIYKGDKFFLKTELFDNTEEGYFINAAVRLSYIDQKAAKLQAIEILDKALDLLRSHITIDTNLQIRDESFLIADTEGWGQSFSFGQSTRHEHWRLFLSYDLDLYPISTLSGGKLSELFEKTSEFLFLPLDKQTEIERKISYSLHFFRKGEETTNIEDKLINYWVVIENLLSFKPSKINIILPKNESEDSKASIPKEVIPRLFVSQFIQQVSFQLYWYLWALIESSDLSLPLELIEACNLNRQMDSGEIALSSKPLLANLQPLIDLIDRKIVKEKCIFTQKFYNDKSFAKDLLKRQMEHIKDDIILIYRYRNQIVHNAQFDSTVLPHFVRKARELSKYLLKRIVYERSVDKNINVEQIIIADYTRANRILHKLENNAPIDFLDLDF
jgi:hypothetical protein